MSQRLINRSPDLKQLRDEGYDIEVRAGHLLLKRVPYVNSQGCVAYGTLVSTIDLANDVTVQPSTHVALFIGDHPCHRDGAIFHEIQLESKRQPLGPDLVTNHSFSSKPPGGCYRNYFEKMTTYANIISGPARQIDPSVSPQSYPVIVADEEESVFQYIDTASSRAGIGAVSRKLELAKVAIIGIGGTGSYVLDLVAKTPVKKIHLFDGDVFSQHNAFRSPGAPSKEDLEQRPRKTDYFRAQYSKIHRGIIAHTDFLDGSAVQELREMNFVFLCLDRGLDKRFIIDALLEFDVPFIDAGLGVQLDGESLGGVLRVTTSTVNRPATLDLSRRIPLSEGRGDDAYSSNIQVADLNALNAALAVVKWKKIFGFYRDLETEHHTTYTLDGNTLTNEDCHEA